MITITIQEQLQYARARAFGARNFTKDKREIQMWDDAVEELTALSLRLTILEAEGGD